MTKGVLVHRTDSIYDDAPSERYQFPRQYLSRAREFVGDWILYYEPRKAAGTRGYFAIARLSRIIPDPQAEGMFLALIEPGTYVDLPRQVSFQASDGLPIERGLLNDEGRISGRAQSAVRPISLKDFDRILDAAGVAEDGDLPRTDEQTFSGVNDRRQADYDSGFVRDYAVQVSTRAVRDRLFRRSVLRAYEERCAITGFKLVNGGGRAEVEAAHIQPVASGGPDSVSNGLALSGTVHWMFDRGLVSASDDLEILISRQINDRESVQRLVNSSGRLLVPAHLAERPSPRFLAWHREHCFKA